MKTFFFRVILFILILELFTNCASKSVSKSFDEFSKNNNGLIIGTITFPKNRQWFDKYSMRLKESEGILFVDYTIKVEEYVNEPAPDNNFTKKYLIIIEKKPGKYLINNFNAFAKDYDQSLSYYGNIYDFSIPIEVKKGEITYIGDIFFDEKINDKDMKPYSSNNNNKMEFKISDNLDRDLKYFKIKNSKVDWSKVIKSVVQPQS
ncbi:MAG: hypothetical protein JST78_08385 [Bacteroidetes bacterium]|nr:hypothetical protein [Bacteroidota bacterium]